MNTKERILLEHYYLEKEIVEEEDKKLNAYLNAYILTNFGIIVDHPKSLTKNMLRLLDDFFHLNIPASYFKNPQDMKYYTKEELLIEQVFSYFFNYGDTTTNSHFEVFKKDLPEYVRGNELVLRTFKIISKTEVNKVLQEIENAYINYTRPFSITELENFKYLYNLGFCKKGTVLKCKDNMFNLLDFDISFVDYLCGKDLVNYSVANFGEQANLRDFIRDARENPDKKYNWVDSFGYISYETANKVLDILELAIPRVKRGTLTKKQAKYFNTLLKFIKQDPDANNKKSPYRAITKAVKDHSKAVEVAEELSKSGSLLNRNIKMLLARAKTIKEKKAIINLLSDKNPIALYQLMSTILTDTGAKRVFTYIHNKLEYVHEETDEEYKKRQSRLDEPTKKLVHDSCLDKILDHYKALPKLGNIYIDDVFEKIALPVNTSASGSGLDVLPTGSRVPFTAKNVRTFVHWKNAFDIDSALTLIDTEGKVHICSFWNYMEDKYAGDVLFSGDCTSKNGAEFWDIKLDGLRKRGIKYVVQSFHGFCSSLNAGEIYCGYQNKDDLNTTAWDPKNIALQFRAKGNTRACVGFALDLETNEFVTLNVMVMDDSLTANGTTLASVKKYLSADLLEDLNMKKILKLRGKVVKDPKDADYVFSADYTGTKDQVVIKPIEVEKLVKIINE